MFSKCLDHAMPAQIVVEVLCGHPMEPSHPFPQPRMVGIRILDVMDSGQDSDPLGQVHRPMGSSLIAGCQGDGDLSSSVGTEDRIPNQERSEHREGLPIVILRKDRLGGRARPVPHHQDRHLFPGEPAFGGSAIAPFSGPSREPAPLPLVGPQEKSLVGFDDAAFLPGLEIGGQGQESVSPQKGRFRVDSALPGRVPNRLPFVEFFQEEYPPVLVMKACQGSIPQRTKGPFAPMGHRYRGSRTHGPMVGSPGGDNEDKRWGFPPGRPPRPPGLSCLATRSPQEDAGLCADVKDPTARRDR